MFNPLNTLMISRVMINIPVRSDPSLVSGTVQINGCGNSCLAYYID